MPLSPTVDRTQTFPLDTLAPQTEIKLTEGSQKRGVGKMCSGIHNIGLALMRLEHVKQSMEDSQITFTVPGQETLRIKPFLPDWWIDPSEEQ